MTEAMIAGQDDAERLADLAQRRLRDKIPQLQLALAGKVRDHHRFLLKEYMDEWKALRERIARIEQEIDKRMRPFEEAVALRESLPGVDHITACSLVAEVGVNVSQFPSAQHLAPWAGLCPAHNESAGKRISGTQ